MVSHREAIDRWEVQKGVLPRRKEEALPPPLVFSSGGQEIPFGSDGSIQEAPKGWKPSLDSYLQHLAILKGNLLDRGEFKCSLFSGRELKVVYPARPFLRRDPFSGPRFKGERL